ncbi:hypothetical protein GCM10008015_26610 [Flavobacterium palustre]|uniref:Uncharacterized protein n=1 Tax=Flavobacterium palustre TaxID=1476463 RepID=A0ABQ1HNM7_9FLAO|nr:hypothetical protein [Flavobacterium palustre]GGA84498.1 hypothetical protein GCM10008015_26610 [Flavobacterium palustre]
MNDLKYVIFKPNSLEERAVIFNGMITHKTISDAIIKNEAFAIVSAGFLSMDNVISCYGDSESLKMKSRGKIDELVISKTLLRLNYF